MIRRKTPLKRSYMKPAVKLPDGSYDRSGQDPVPDEAFKTTPLSPKYLKRSPVKKYRAKPRPGRLKGDEMRLLRIEVWIRDGCQCVRCGKPVDPDAPPEWPNSFHLSHKKGKRMWGDSPETTESNCGDCHRKFHNYGWTMTKPCKPKLKP